MALVRSSMLGASPSLSVFLLDPDCLDRTCRIPPSVVLGGSSRHAPEGKRGCFGFIPSQHVSWVQCLVGSTYLTTDTIQRAEDFMGSEVLRLVGESRWYASPHELAPVFPLDQRTGNFQTWEDFPSQVRGLDRRWDRPFGILDLGGGSSDGCSPRPATALP